MSPYQISGSGDWVDIKKGVKNEVMVAVGARAEHDFHSAIPPIYILKDGTICPVVHIIIKPIYEMLHISRGVSVGQPLKKIALVSTPNGILLSGKSGLLEKYPGLLFPGKDDKGKDPHKMRARISFDKLRAINSWRYHDFDKTKFPVEFAI